MANEWTEKERLAVIERKARQIYMMTQSYPLTAKQQRDVFGFAVEIYMLATADAAFLDANRDRLEAAS